MSAARKSSLALSAAAAFIGACGSLAAEEGSKPKRVCINRREISSIRALDDQHAFVKLGASRHYLLTLDTSCRGLKLSRRIAIADATTRVCGGLSLLSFEYPAVGPVRCRIERIDSVQDQGAALELIESRAPRE